jgi:hypothetical protein
MEQLSYGAFSADLHQRQAGPDIFDENTVNSLTNASQLPVFLIMDCLNGLFQDVYAQPLGVSLILRRTVAVLLYWRQAA